MFSIFPLQVSETSEPSGSHHELAHYLPHNLINIAVMLAIAHGAGDTFKQSIASFRRKQAGGRKHAGKLVITQRDRRQRTCLRALDKFSATTNDA